MTSQASDDCKTAIRRPNASQKTPKTNVAKPTKARKPLAPAAPSNDEFENVTPPFAFFHLEALAAAMQPVMSAQSVKTPMMIISVRKAIISQHWVPTTSDGSDPLTNSLSWTAVLEHLDNVDPLVKTLVCLEGAV